MQHQERQWDPARISYECLSTAADAAALCANQMECRSISSSPKASDLITILSAGQVRGFDFMLLLTTTGSEMGPAAFHVSSFTEAPVMVAPGSCSTIPGMVPSQVRTAV